MQTELPPGSPIQSCPHCEALIDITEREPLEVIDCPECGQRFAVSGHIDHYQVIEVAGRGGMGVVYKAYDPSLDRYVALKLLKKSQSNDAKLIELLETEAAITASINDPNVVRVYGTGRDRGRFFLAMELVEKGSLDDLIHLQGRVAEAQVLEVGIQIAKGLRAAHQQGLIHRDVKPGNVLFADAHTAKIVDFGLAIFMAQEESVRGEVWGTPYYVAPEKLDQEPEDFRSDMYSLGGTLFHALAGRPPFEAENASLVALKHLKSQAVRLQAFAPWVSNATSHIINRTLEKNPDNRYQSYDELINNLEYALEELLNRGSAPQQRARVVTATNEEDQKVWTWVVLGMIAVIVVLGGYFAVHGLKSKPTAGGKAQAAATASELASLEKELTALSNRTADAPEAFQAAANNSALSVTDRAWAQFLAGVSQLALNHSTEARTAFGRIEPLAARMKDETQAKFLRQSATRLSSTDIITKAETKDLNSTNYEAIALLAYGLHDWNRGRIEAGAELLREYRNASPNSSFAWINSLKPISTHYLEEIAAMEMSLAQLKSGGDAQRSAVAEKLKDFSPPVKNRLEAALNSGSTGSSPAQGTTVSPPASSSPTTSHGAPGVAGRMNPGLFRFINKQTGKAIDVGRFNTKTGADIGLYNNFSQANEIWEVVQTSSGDVRFRPFHAPLWLTVPRSQQDDNLAIQLWTQNDTPAQIWKAEPQGNVDFKIRSTATNKLLSIQNQTSIVQRTDDGQPDQVWTFERVGKRLNSDWLFTVVGRKFSLSGDKATANSDQFVITNQGRDIWETNDECGFITRDVSGDFELVARVVSNSSPNENSKAGLMIRETLDAQSTNIGIFITTAGRVIFQSRAVKGEATTSVSNPAQSLPCWLKLERHGGKTTGSYSTDGNTWKELGSRSVTSNPHVFVGIAYTSHDPEKPGTGTFDKVTFTAK